MRLGIAVQPRGLLYGLFVRCCPSSAPLPSIGCLCFRPALYAHTMNARLFPSSPRRAPSSRAPSPTRATKATVTGRRARLVPASGRPSVIRKPRASSALAYSPSGSLTTKAVCAMALDAHLFAMGAICVWGLGRDLVWRVAHLTYLVVSQTRTPRTTSRQAQRSRRSTRSGTRMKKRRSPRRRSPSGRPSLQGSPQGTVLSSPLQHFRAFMAQGARFPHGLFMPLGFRLHGLCTLPIFA